MQIDETQFNINIKNDKKAKIYDEQIINVKIQQILKSVIKKEGYIKFEVNKKIFKDSGNGFLGILCEADVKGKTADGEKEANIFAKFKAPSEKIAILSLSDAYIRELFVYKEISKVFDDLQNEFDVPKTERYVFAKLYDESNKEAIVMENLCKKGFSMNHRMDVISLDFAKAATKELAKFHALSFVLQSKRPVFFRRRLSVIKHLINFNNDWNSMVNNVGNSIMSYLEEGVKKKFEKFVPKHLELYQKYLEDNTGVCCLCHGDYRPGNIMKKEIDGKIKQVIPIDFQIVYYGNPIHDLLYFIFGATDQKFRRNHLKFIKDYYYKALKNFLLHFNMEIETIFPRVDFERRFKERLDFGLMTSMVMLPLTLSPDDAVPDLTTGDVDFHASVTDVCKKRMTGLIEDFIEWGYL